MDLGYDGCQAGPGLIQVASPIHFGGMPTDFTTDASGSALQPGVNSSAWANLLRVQRYEPTLPRSSVCNTELYLRCGIFNHTFAIQQSSQASDVPPRATGAISNILVEIGAPTDYLVDISSLFLESTQVCCPNISLNIVQFLNALADARSLEQSPVSGPDMSFFSQAFPPVPSPSSFYGSAYFQDLSNGAAAAMPALPGPSTQPSPISGSSPSTMESLLASASIAPAATSSASLQAGRRLLQATGQIPLPFWLTAQLQLKLSDSDPNQLLAWQYINISRATPVSAIGRYIVEVIAQNPGSDLTSTVLFNLNIVDYYQLAVSLALAGIPASGLSATQQDSFQAGVSSAFGLSASQISFLATPSNRRSLLQASTYVLKFSITGLNGKATAEALAQSLEQSVSSGQLNQQLTASGEERFNVTMLARTLPHAA